MRNAATIRQPWINNASFDAWFILAPPFISLLIVSLLPQHFKNSSEMPLIGWVLLVLFIDVAHVYSTLFKTYFNPVYFNRQRALFIWTPLICYAFGVMLHSISGMLFWRVLAYIAVFHFVRQQYGFMRLYSRYESKKNMSSRIDAITIYSATIYPMIYWHCTPGRNFTWFVEGDFVQAQAQVVKQVALVLYLVIIIAYIAKEIRNYIKTHKINLPRNAIITGTAVSWYFGIVYFNGDMAFTLLNVVSHGIPYMALVWFRKQPGTVHETLRKPLISRITSGKLGWVFFIVSIVLFAYLEEGFWDGFVWKEHNGLFALFTSLPKIENTELLALLVPLLALPQLTHYILDGFIWRREPVQQNKSSIMS